MFQSNHVSDFVHAHNLRIGVGVELGAMLAGGDAVAITVLVPLPIDVGEHGPMLTIRVDNVGIADVHGERVVALERDQLLDILPSVPVSDFHDDAPVWLGHWYNLLFLGLFGVLALCT